MSMSNGRITCTGRDFNGYLQYRPITLIYQFDDGAEVESHRAIGQSTEVKVKYTL